MKPTIQTGRLSRSSDSSSLNSKINHGPKTDWSYQVSSLHLRGSNPPFHPGTQPSSSLRPSFHALSQGFFTSEAGRESRFEGALFGVIVALAVWPIAIAIQAATVLVK